MKQGGGSGAPRKSTVLAFFREAVGMYWTWHRKGKVER